MGERKCTCVSAVTQPFSRQGRTRSISMISSSVSGVISNTLRSGRISKPLETSRYTRPSGRSSSRLAGDIGAGVGVHMAEIDAVILEPGRVDDAVAVDRRQVLPAGAVHVQLDRGALSAALLAHLQAHALVGRRQRAQERAGLAGPHLGDGNHLPAGQVETGIRMGGVFDQQAEFGPDRELVVVAGLPALVRVLQAGCGGDHLAEVQLNLFEQAVRIQARLKFAAFGELQQGGLARLPAQRRLGCATGGHGRR